MAWWLYHESRRRSTLQPELFCGNYVVSFPRSGNHAVRFAIEYLSGRPTLGARDHESHLRPAGLHDVPIFLLTEHIVVSEPLEPPIAVKRHALRPEDRVHKMVLIKRDPVEAILSHTNRNGRASQSDLRDGLAKWQELANVYAAQPAESRLLIHFEDIFLSNVRWIYDLVAFLDITTTHESVLSCNALMGEAKEIVAREPQTEALDTYRSRYPEAASIIDAMLQDASRFGS